MRIPALIPLALLLLAACGSGDAGAGPEPAAESEAPLDRNAANPSSSATPSPAARAAGERKGPGARWDLQSSGEGTALVLLTGEVGTVIRLFCPARENRLLVNVPGFRPIGSEERLSFGGGGDAVALVADPRGDAQRGGVSGTGAVPANLAALVGGAISASYGAQTSGPHPAPPRDLARGFLADCGEGPPKPAPAKTPAAGAAGACLMQDGERLEARRLRALGTEPFWAARIEGRCVTYSHPEDQDGTRVWTRFTPAPGGGTWSGALGGRRFELRIAPRPGCSDGMSDRRYPLKADLVLGGERRSGCAEPL